jgi:hypothetical protein
MPEQEHDRHVNVNEFKPELTEDSGNRIVPSANPNRFTPKIAIIYALIIIAIAATVAGYSIFGTLPTDWSVPELDSDSSGVEIEPVDVVVETLEMEPAGGQPPEPVVACEPATCGDGVCSPDCEDITSCPADCGTPVPYDPCGNGVCDPGEHVYNCTPDCGEPPADSGGSCACNFKCYVYDAKDKSICLQGAGVDCNGNACTP